MKYQVTAKINLGFGEETMEHYSGESLEAAMEDYQMDMRQVSRGRLDRVELVADGAVIRFMDKGGQDTEIVAEQEAPKDEQPVLVVVWMSSPKGWTPRYSAKALVAGETDSKLFSNLKTEAEAWQALEKYPNREVVSSHQEFLNRQQAQLQAMGTSFEQESFLHR
jgi:hypothetical protein